MAYHAASGMQEMSILDRRRKFITMSGMSVLVGFLLGIRNSSNRLEGLVPNGLAARKVREPVKYNYTSQFLSKSIWSIFIEPQRRPTQ